MNGLSQQGGLRKKQTNERKNDGAISVLQRVSQYAFYTNALHALHALQVNKDNYLFFKMYVTHVTHVTLAVSKVIYVTSFCNAYVTLIIILYLNGLSQKGGLRNKQTNKQNDGAIRVLQRVLQYAFYTNALHALHALHVNKDKFFSLKCNETRTNFYRYLYLNFTSNYACI